VTAAVALAFAAAVCAVLAAWEVAAAAEHVAWAGATARLLAPLRRRDPFESSQQAGERRRLAIVLALVGAGCGTLLGGALAGALVAALAPWGLSRIVALRRERWREELTAGAPAVARALADAIAVGRPVRGAISVVGSGGGATRAAEAELAVAAHLLALGARTEEVLERLRARAASPAWDTIVAAILLQRDAGGDLAGLLRTIASDLEAGRRAEADARTATAQARMTARIVAGLPVAAMTIAELAAPGTLARMLGSPLSAMLVAGAAALELTALAAVARLARLEARA